MRVGLRPAARNDLREIFRYLAKRNPTAAVATRQTIQAQLALLASHPGLGRSGRIPETRELALAHTPYIAAYRVDHDADAVYVLRILHGAQRWPEDSDNG